MAQPLRLETFDDTEVTSARMTSRAYPEREVEELRLSSYDEGYAAGWEDAVAAQDAEADRMRADLARNLQALSFTYHEARGHVLRAVEPLLKDIVTKVLPMAAREALGRMVWETVAPAVETLAGSEITVVVSPESRHRVEAALGTGSGLPFRYVEEPSLDCSQVYLRIGEVEQRIDLGAVVVAIQSAIAGYFHIEENEVKHA